MSDPIAVLNVLKLTPMKLPEGSLKLAPLEIADFKERMQEMLTQQYTNPVDYESHPGNQTYATVMVGGKVVATLDNNGCMTSGNATDTSGLPSNGHGPALAQQRAEFMAKKLGGTVVKASTALTPAQHAMLPPLQMKTDFAALKADPLYQQYFNNAPSERTLATLVGLQEVLASASRG